MKAIIPFLVLCIGLFELYSATESIESKVIRVYHKKPEKLALIQQHKNPFGSKTVLHYELPSNTHLTVSILNHSGKQIKVLYNNYCRAGTYKLVWENARIKSGIYYCQLSTRTEKLTRPIALLR
jgi:hypothetical protein